MDLVRLVDGPVVDAARDKRSSAATTPLDLVLYFAPTDHDDRRCWLLLADTGRACSRWARWRW